MIQENLTHKVDAIQNTATVIAKSLEEKIYEAELEPGQQLVQESIASMFGVSRVPVRDALQILINMGLAVSIPRRGVFVRRLSSGLLRELFEIRIILEGAAIKIAVMNITPAEIKTLKKIISDQKMALKRNDVKLNERLDTEFHATIFRTLNNQTLIDLVNANWSRIRQARCTSTVDSEHGNTWIAESIQRHVKLLEAIEGNDADSAYRTVVENIEDSQLEISKSLLEKGWLDTEEEAAA